MTVLLGASVVTPDGVLDDGWVLLDAGTIAGVGSGRPPADQPTVDVCGRWLLPGYIDIHVHGGGGFDFAASPSAMAGAVAYHRGHGTTATLVSLVTAPVDQLCEQLRWVARLAALGPQPDGHVLGAHLEGPFLAPGRCGAQNPDNMLLPDPGVAAALIRAGAGYLRTMTVAPEIFGGLELVDQLVEAGVVAALGHSEATYAQARTAFLGGATLLTHAYNGMRPLHHREPGPVPAAFDAGVACEIINDGLHVHPAAVRMVPIASLILVTDAIDATGNGDGRYRLGGQDVEVVDGQARLVANGALAGSTLTMDRAVRRAVHEVGLPIEVASAAASGNPARVLGIDDRFGTIAPGKAADLVVLDDQLAVTRVMIKGQWTEPVTDSVPAG